MIREKIVFRTTGFVFEAKLYQIKERHGHHYDKKY